MTFGEPAGETSSPTLEQLPIEIQGMILERLSSVNDLLALIAASPIMLQLYCLARDRIFVATIRNEIGGSLVQHAAFLAKDPYTIYQLDDFLNTAYDCSTVDAKKCYEQERLTQIIIQMCVDDELGVNVDLTPIEWLRLKRGMYNLRVATRLGNLETEPEDWTQTQLFCRQRSSFEVMEMLYIWHCLQNRYAKHLQSLDDVFLDDVLYHRLQPDFYEEHLFFSQTYHDTIRFSWNQQGPLSDDIQLVYELCQVPSPWQSALAEDSRYRPFFDYDEIHPGSILESIIPTDHNFETSEGEGFRWLQRFRLTGHQIDYHHAIPLGFMIWDDQRLKSMSWIQSRPPMEAVQQKWQLFHQDYLSVEGKFRAILDFPYEDRQHLNMYFTHRRRQVS